MSRTYHTLYEDKHTHKPNQTYTHGFLADLEEPTDNVSGMSPAELDAVRLSSRTMLRHRVRHNAKKIRREFW
jgi:hypothetical protein